MFVKLVSLGMVRRVQVYRVYCYMYKDVDILGREEEPEVGKLGWQGFFEISFEIATVY